ncbi:restriction endonuclease subunit S [Enterococcus faecalis]|nr:MULTISPECIES: restriction endonuclease subunit S [Enterococcus]EFQ12379.1 type I restriction modification DNA specificity domain protein [Enterococcus faecalis TX0102]EGO6041310.1 restriction endonuclease subunit S [Enterococcus faecalis]EGO6064212.1 restriction endonuclease subunit S [Enterococcus faecalis]EGO7747911.1 restriction endonuclease subunit S [Enterococcus faecalis]EGO8066867.1 restriction endonuclease subunit S [Enterococcus faecalis]
MSNDTQPEIRFPGFTEDWEQRKLEDISDKVTEKNKNNEFTETLTNSAEFGIINQREFFDKDISNEKNLNGYYIVREDDFVYNPRISNYAPVGPIKRNKLGRTGVMSPLYYVFRPHDIDKKFLEYFFGTTIWHKFMKLNGDSGARADRFAIKDSVFKTMPIPYPSIEEQKKVGKFFDDLNDTIALHQRKLDLLKETKKGFLQKMFPKNGAKVPEIRFPGFTKDWEQRKLGDFVVDYVEKTSVQNQFPMLTSSQQKGIVLQEDYFANRQVTTENNIGYFVLPRGYFTFRSRSDNDVFVFNRNDIIDRGIISYFYPVFTLKSADSDFFLRRINNGIQRQLSIQAEGTGQHVLSLKKFKNIVAMFPSEEEQQKIGTFFKQLDDTITLHQRKLDLLKETKKGFLQKMFV